MNIRRLVAWRQPFELLRPYTIAFKHFDSAENVLVRLETDGRQVGYGAGSPEALITGETMASCAAALAPDGAVAAWLGGRDVADALERIDDLHRLLPGAPAARAAVETALLDLVAKEADMPLARWLGQSHAALPTSITIGIKDLSATLAEADEYLGRGFCALKLKLGEGLGPDVERTVKLREHVGRRATIRVDINQAYTSAELLAFVERTSGTDIELIEQPLPAASLKEYRELPGGVRALIALDESVLSPEDALAAVSPSPAAGIFNIKLMKCGGVLAARRIARVAEGNELRLMWGCMDESRISIAAALHAAFACPATRFLDLDGSLDLGDDVVGGGFAIENGVMRLVDAPGLGVRWLDTGAP